MLLDIGEINQAREYFNDQEMLEMLLFHRKFELESYTELTPQPWEILKARADFIQEELNELYKAIDQRDLDGAIDSLVDQVVVVKGTALMMGLRWNLHWKEVWAKNMEKVRGFNPKRPDLKEDLVKPKGWTSPYHMRILKTYASEEIIQKCLA